MCHWKAYESLAPTLPVIDIAATGENILRLRKTAGLTVRDLQEMFGFATPQAIYKWQSGGALPTLEHIAALSRVLGISIEEIIVWKADAPALPSGEGGEREP